MKDCKFEDGLIEINVKNEKILRKNEQEDPLSTLAYVERVSESRKRKGRKKKKTCRHNGWKLTKSNGKH